MLLVQHPTEFGKSNADPWKSACSFQEIRLSMWLCFYGTRQVAQVINLHSNSFSKTHKMPCSSVSSLQVARTRGSLSYRSGQWDSG